MASEQVLQRIKRVVKLMGLLQGGRDLNARALAEACGVTKRTIFRDLDALRRADVPLHFDDERQTYCIPGRYFLPPTNFTADEALALLILCYELGDDDRLPFYALARQAAEKLATNLPERLTRLLRKVSGSVRIRMDATNPLHAKRDLYYQLIHAVAQREAVRIAYRSLHEGDQIQTKLHPYKLLFNQHSWYVIGRSTAHREVRTFNLGRIERLDLLGEQFSPPPRFTLESYLRNAWRLIPEPGPDQLVRIRFQPRVAQNVAEVLWHKTQQVEWIPDGSLEFRVTVSGIHEISWWILGYGDQAEVLEPLELRTLIANRVREMAAIYAAEPAAGRSAAGKRA